jgi:hypothetical protein
MPDAQNDNCVCGDAIENQVGVRTDDHASDAFKVGHLAQVRMVKKQSRDSAHSFSHAPRALRGLGGDIVDNAVDLADGSW